jgi:hypothetical protein
MKLQVASLVMALVVGVLPTGAVAENVRPQAGGWWCTVWHILC